MKKKIQKSPGCFTRFENSGLAQIALKVTVGSCKVTWAILSLQNGPGSKFELQTVLVKQPGLFFLYLFFTFF
jgi:hypothetical protein